MPKRLNAGDRIALIAPASPIYEKENRDAAVRAVESLGLCAVRYPTVDMQLGYLAGDDEARASDLIAALKSDVRGIFCLRGGYGAARLLSRVSPYLPLARDKVFLGFSDITAINLPLLRIGIPVLHAPMPGENKREGFHNEKSLAQLRSLLFSPFTGRLENPSGEPFRRFDGSKRGRARGKLIGGNLQILCSLIGTPYLPPLDGALLLIEEIGKPPYYIDGFLTQLRNAGALDAVAGIVLGKFLGCEDRRDKPSLPLKAVLESTLPQDKPILENVHAGHGADKLSLPLGLVYELDTEAETLSLLESYIE